MKLREGTTIHPKKKKEKKLTIDTQLKIQISLIQSLRCNKLFRWLPKKKTFHSRRQPFHGTKKIVIRIIYLYYSCEHEKRGKQVIRAIK